MGQKVNPVGMRVGINRDWNSKWFARKKDYGTYLVEDLKIRRFLEKDLKKSMLSHVSIGRVKAEKGNDIRVRIYVAKPGDVLGQDGGNINRIKGELAKLVPGNELHLDVVEVKNPDLDAVLVAKWIASELENRAAFRSTMKKAIQRMRKAGAKGCKTLCSGRLGGAEIARDEGYKEGVVPLHTIRADIDFAHVPAATTYGNIGVKVWICRSLNKVGTEEVNEPAPHEEGRPEFRRDRRDARPERRAPRGGDNNASTKAN
jgi:small subunit ribosomal protein S3